MHHRILRNGLFCPCLIKERRFEGAGNRRSRLTPDRGWNHLLKTHASNTVLSSRAEELKLDRYIIKNPVHHGRVPEGTLSSMVEAILGAVWLIQTEIQTKFFMSWRNWDCTSLPVSSKSKGDWYYTVLGTCLQHLPMQADLTWHIPDSAFEMFPVFTMQPLINYMKCART